MSLETFGSTLVGACILALIIVVINLIISIALSFFDRKDF